MTRYMLDDIRSNFEQNSENMFWKKARRIILNSQRETVAMMGQLIKTACAKFGVTALEKFRPTDQMGLQRLMAIAERQMEEKKVKIWDRPPDYAPGHPERTGIFFTKGEEIAYWISWPMASQKDDLVLALPNEYARDPRRLHYFILTNVPA